MQQQTRCAVMVTNVDFYQVTRHKNNGGCRHKGHKVSMTHILIDIHRECVHTLSIVAVTVTQSGFFWSRHPKKHPHELMIVQEGNNNGNRNGIARLKVRPIHTVPNKKHFRVHRCLVCSHSIVKKSSISAPATSANRTLIDLVSVHTSKNSVQPQPQYR